MQNAPDTMNERNGNLPFYVVSLTLIVLCIATFILAPYVLFKFIVIGFLLDLVFAFHKRHYPAMAGVFIINALFILSFLLTPIAWTLSTKTSSPVWFFQALSIVCGLICLYLAVPEKGEPILTPPRSKHKSIAFKNFLKLESFTGTFLALFLAVIFHRTLNADLSYGGDEHYHVASAQMCRALFNVLVSEHGFIIVLVLWLALGVFSYKLRRLNPANFKRIYYLWILLGGIGFGLSALRSYPTSIEDPFILERSARYPSILAWLCGFIGIVTNGNTENLFIPFDLLRLLPLSSLLICGFIILKSRLTSGLSFPIKFIFTIGVLTIPIFLFNGTLIYLELPIVAVATIALFDFKKWLGASYPHVCRSWSFLSVITLCFLKETGMIIALILVLCRAIIRFARDRDRAQPRFSLTEEIKVFFAIMLPGLLYLLYRNLCGFRPYNLNLENLLSFKCWSEALYYIILEFGGLLLFALFGLVVAMRKYKYFAVLCTACFIGVFLFHFLEDPRWIGLSRFNLLLAPPLIALAVVGFKNIAEFSTKNNICTQTLTCLFVSLILLALNVAMSPVDIYGRRGDWGKSGERWYNWSECFADIKKESTMPEILIGNMSSKYAFGIVLQKVNIMAEITQLPPINSADEREDLNSIFARASNDKCDYVIYRYESKSPQEFPQNSNNYKKFKCYPARVGGLLLYKSQNK